MPAQGGGGDRRGQGWWGRPSRPRVVRATVALCAPALAGSAEAGEARLRLDRRRQPRRRRSGAHGRRAAGRTSAAAASARAPRALARARPGPPGPACFVGRFEGVAARGLPCMARFGAPVAIRRAGCRIEPLPARRPGRRGTPGAAVSRRRSTRPRRAPDRGSAPGRGMAAAGRVLLRGCGGARAR